jgi:hypothetical protein
MDIRGEGCLKKNPPGFATVYPENEIAFVILVRNDYREWNAGPVFTRPRQNMRRKLLNKYSIAAILLIAAAAALIVIALDTSPTEFITAAYVISAMTCAITGIFILTFSGGEPVDPRFVGILPAQGCINLCKIASDLGINGNAYFLPSRLTDTAQVMQFNPTSTYTGTNVSVKESFPKTGPGGLVTIPSCRPLIQDLRKRNALIIPDNEDQIIQLLQETIGDIFEFAPRVSVQWHENTVTVTFHRYRFIAGCQFIAQESPGCCTRNPCPACSLCGALIAEGTGKVIVLEQCSMSSSFRDVNQVFRILPGPDRQP